MLREAISRTVQTAKGDDMKGVSGLAVILLLALAAGVATAKWPALQASQVLQQNGVVLFSRPLTVSDFTFTDENGAPITRQDLMGKKVLMFFGYTFCPDICPTTLMDLRRTWKRLPDSVKQGWQVVLVSIDPARDLPENLGPYMHYFNRDFKAMTGNPQALKTLAAELNALYHKVERGEGQAYLMDHSANLAVLDEQGNYLGYIEPPHGPGRMVTLIEALSVR
ncbi:MAG: SCO family protein [Oceanospirillaceae bacterium]|nr:SCO family protein [Thalassolituus sp.]MAS25095.1 SCO family protein [Oceanospirillaceae bacterium]MAX99953.1 SCO family protein [Oceanospirillaceae bacterium]MBL36140.1 SCO family protein [Oceanospirillaceae bacterium]MBS53088.1 SCO family protein [Oceanospirillaceae bacterium]|tara:strand:- start:2496 stop:3164 length:669 start_codon:yes stop_codon:yes gene_type:complete